MEGNFLGPSLLSSKSASSDEVDCDHVLISQV
jgi:hypothetical protein